MDASDLKSIPIICGPTGSGKTAAAVELSKSFPIEIISADSRQIIKYLNIGTAKPSKEEQIEVAFHLIDIINPGERYTAFKFIDDAGEAIDSILKKGKIPLLVGGTGLYLRALSEGVVEIENDDFTIRENLEKELQEKGAEILYRRLREIDPLEATKFHPNNNVRLIRSLEIYYLTGKPKSEIIATGAYRKSEHDYKYYSLIPERNLLYKRINERVDQMMADNLLDELELLIKKGMKEQIKDANVIGYNELLEYLDGNISLLEAVSMIKQNSRRYAKRQITWFNKQKDCKYFQNENNLSRELHDFLNDWQNNN